MGRSEEVDSSPAALMLRAEGREHLAHQSPEGVAVPVEGTGTGLVVEVLAVSQTPKLR